MPTDLKSVVESYKWPSAVWLSRSCAIQEPALDFMDAGREARASLGWHPDLGDLEEQYDQTRTLDRLCLLGPNKKTSVTKPFSSSLLILIPLFR